MKKTRNLILSIGSIFAINTQAQNNSITITESDLKGGGQEFVIKGGPDVVTKTKFGTIYSDESQMIILKNNNKLVRYSGAVNFEMEKLKLVIESKEMTDSGNGIFSFDSAISIESYSNEKIETTASFTCENGKVKKDGQSTGKSSVTYRGVLTISCSSNNVLTVAPKQF